MNLVAAVDRNGPADSRDEAGEEGDPCRPGAALETRPGPSQRARLRCVARAGVIGHLDPAADVQIGRRAGHSDADIAPLKDQLTVADGQAVGRKDQRTGYILCFQACNFGTFPCITLRIKRMRGKGFLCFASVSKNKNGQKGYLAGL